MSAHATHLVGSALSDPYLSFAAGMCGKYHTFSFGIVVISIVITILYKHKFIYSNFRSRWTITRTCKSRSVGIFVKGMEI